MRKEPLAEQPELTKIRRLLENQEPVWPETIVPGEEYQIQADDNDGDPDVFWLSIKVDESGDVTLKLDDRECVFRFCPGGAKQRVRNALLIVAEAIRLNIEEDKMDRRTDQLKEIHKLLKHITWLTVLNNASSFEIQPDSGNDSLSIFSLAVFFNQDAFIGIGWHIFRFRTSIGGGRHQNMFFALMILAVAIKLDTET